MTIQLKPDQEIRIAEALRSGASSSTDDVIDRALEVLRQEDEWLTANRQEIHVKIRQGIAELERGEGIAEEALDAYLQRLKSKGVKRRFLVASQPARDLVSIWRYLKQESS